MTLTCTIRKLDRDDAEAWAFLRREALEAHPLVFGASVLDDPAGLVETARARLAVEEATIFGAFVDAKLVGIVGVFREQGKKERHKSFLWGMYVAAQSRRHGTGKLLLQAAIDQARSWHGVRQVHLSVSDVAVEARRLYERHGFRAWGVEPRALCWEGQCADEIHMILGLQEPSAPYGTGMA
jgi:GNAT superfamily N-acetyltransferase